MWSYLILLSVACLCLEEEYHSGSLELAKRVILDYWFFFFYPNDAKKATIYLQHRKSFLYNSSI